MLILLFPVALALNITANLSYVQNYSYPVSPYLYVNASLLINQTTTPYIYNYTYVNATLNQTQTNNYQITPYLYLNASSINSQTNYPLIQPYTYVNASDTGIYQVYYILRITQIFSPKSYYFEENNNTVLFNISAINEKIIDKAFVETSFGKFVLNKEYNGTYIWISNNLYYTYFGVYSGNVTFPEYNGTVKICVNNTDGLYICTPLNITVNLPPRVKILFPENNSFFNTPLVNITCWANDTVPGLKEILLNITNLLTGESFVYTKNASETDKIILPYKEGHLIIIYNPNPYDLIEYQLRINLTKLGINYTFFKILDQNNISLPFCYEQPNGECNTTPSNIIWVKVNLTANSNTTIYLIPDDKNNAVNGDQVFDFYDDFNDNTLNTDKWTIYGTLSITLTGNSLQMSTDSPPAGIYATINEDLTKIKGIIIEKRCKIVSGSEDSTTYISSAIPGNSGKGYLFHHYGWGGTLSRIYYGWWITTLLGEYSESSVPTSYVIIKDIIINESSQYRLIFEQNDIIKINTTTSSIENPLSYFGIFQWSGVTWDYDWIRIRKYTDQEPQIVSVRYFSNYTLYIPNHYTFSLNLSEGKYTYFCEAEDLSGKTNRTDIYYLTVDLTPPQITIYSPQNNTVYNTSRIWLNYTVKDLSPVACWYVLRGAVNETGYLSTPIELLKWRYRRKIEIYNPNSYDLEDFQVKIVFNSSLIYGKAKPDGSDIRFTYLNLTDLKEYEIPFCFESSNDECINTTNVDGISNITVWIKVPYIPANGTAIIYMYYGNPNAEAMNYTGKNVFDFYDDFNNYNTTTFLKKWATYGLTVTDTCPNFSCCFDPSDCLNNECSAWIDKGCAGWNHYIYNSSLHYSFPLIVEARVKAIDYSYAETSCLILYTDDNSSATICQTPDFVILKVIDLSGTNLIKIDHYYGESAGYWRAQAYIDWIRIRKYANVEPTYNISQEELIYGKCVNTTLILPDGEYNLILYAKDIVGHIAYKIVYFKVNTTIYINVISPKNNTIVYSPFIVNASIVGPAVVKWININETYFNFTNSSGTYYWSYVTLPEGNYTLRVCAENLDGKIFCSDSIFFTVIEPLRIVAKVLNESYNETYNLTPFNNYYLYLNLSKVANVTINVFGNITNLTNVKETYYQFYLDLVPYGYYNITITACVGVCVNKTIQVFVNKFVNISVQPINITIKPSVLYALPINFTLITNFNSSVYISIIAPKEINVFYDSFVGNFTVGIWNVTKYIYVKGTLPGKYYINYTISVIG